MPELDWFALHAQGEEKLRFIRQLEGFYVFVHASASVMTRTQHSLLSASYRDDPRFLGYCLLGGSYAHPWLADANWLERGEYLPLLEVLQRQMRSGGRIGMLTFCATPEEQVLLHRFRAWTFDYMAYLTERNLPVVYTPLAEERDITLTQLPRYLAVVDDMDVRSQRAMRARLAALASLDRHLLQKEATPLAHMYFNGTNEEDSFLPRDRETYVDVGATEGAELLRVAGLVDNLEQSRFWGVEPNATDFARLKQLRFFLQLRACRAFASERDGGTVDFYTDPVVPYASRVVFGGEEDAWRQANAAHIEAVPCLTLDTLVSDPVTLLKIDVEGGELSVLQGAVGHVSRPDCRVAAAVYHYPQDVLEVCEFFRELGRERLRLRQHDSGLWDLICYADDPSVTA
ncbi:FkbM family methyltransferase [Bordetella trematum]|uniref:FkbM family methyltransferase n=1 Tax=Bordetella trematum TaxID=123899 RepID=UPI003989F7E9